MTIKTLTYIHNLLTEESNRKESALNVLRKARNEAEDNHASNFQSLQNAYDEMRESLKEAKDALWEFENHEWR